jgi:hypothetical protein
MAGGALAALGAHAALADSSWWWSLALTAVCGIAAYAALLLVVLPKGERAALSAMLARAAGRRAVETPN